MAGFNEQILRNSTFQIQSALGTNITITGITNANPAVVTATNSLSDGDYVVLSAVNGMKLMNDRLVRVTSATGTSFACEGLDTTDTALHGVYSSGGIANEVTSWESFQNVTGINLPPSTPDEVDLTAITDIRKQKAFTYDGDLTATIDIYEDPGALSIAEVILASDKRTSRAFKLVTQSGRVYIFNATQVAGADGFSGTQGQAVTNQFTVNLPYRMQSFAS